MRRPAAGASWIRTASGWRCPACGKEFVQAGLWHSCGVFSLEHHFRGRTRARVLFDAFCAAVEQAGGPFRLSIAKTRIGLITGMTFAAVMPRKAYLRAHVLLPRRVRSPRFVRVDPGPPHWVHVFEVRDERDLDGELRGWLRDSYRLGLRGSTFRHRIRG